MSYKDTLTKLTAYGIEHYKFDPSSLRVSEETFWTTISLGKKEVDIQVPFFEVTDLEGNVRAIKPHSYGVPCFTWLFNASVWKTNGVKEKFSWGAFASLARALFENVELSTRFNRAETLCNFILRAVSVSQASELWMHTFRGWIAGISTNYNADITEFEILDTLNELGFAEHVSGVWSEFGSHSKSLNFLVRLEGLNKVRLLIRNGFSGDTALTYRISVVNDNGDSVYVSKPVSRNLHRGNLSDTIENLVSALEDTKSKEVFKRLDAQLSTDFLVMVGDAIADVEAFDSLELERGDVRRKLQKVSSGEKAIGRLREAFNAATVNVRNTTGLEAIEALRLASQSKRCLSNMNLVIEYVLEAEFITNELLEILREEQGE